MPTSYPIFLNLAARPVLIVGGGSVGLRKARGLLASGADIHLASPTFVDGFAGLNITRHVGEYSPALLARLPRWILVFAATDRPAVNAQVARDAAAAAVLCCRCDDPDVGDFGGGAMHAVGPVSLAVSTAGGSPVLATRLRDAAAQSIDPVLVQWAQLLAAWRPQVLAQVADPAARRGLLQRLAGPELEHALRGLGAEAAEDLFQEWLAAAPR